MNLISQHCLAGYLYRIHMNEPYGNPFIWSVIDYDSMHNLITNFNDIDFFNIEMIHDDHMIFSIVIDHSVKVQYVHYRFDPTATTIIGNRDNKIGGDIRYNRIWEYIFEKYMSRLFIMQKTNTPPLFCICNFNTVFKDAIYTNDQLDSLANFDNVIIHRGCEHMAPLPAAAHFYSSHLTKFK